MQRLRQDLAVHFIGVLVVVRGKARQHFIEEYTKCPPVDRLVVSLSKEQLWGEVLRSTAKRYAMSVGLIIVDDVGKI